MAPRNDEEHCRASFERYLRETGGVTDVTWTPFPRGESKPPDFALDIGTTTYAVEVTSLFTQYELPDGTSVPEATIWKATERLADDVEAEAAARGLLRGGYVVTVDGPYANFFGSRREIRKHLLDFISATRDVDETPPELEFHRLLTGQRYAVNKYASSSNWVAAAMHSDGGWEWEVVTELRMLVEAAVAAKARKMRDVPPPWVLLLLDRHHLARSADYERVRQKLAPSWSDAGSAGYRFHAVYLVQADGGVFPLKTTD